MCEAPYPSHVVRLESSVFGPSAQVICVPVARIARLLEGRGERALRRLLSPGERQDCASLGKTAQRCASRVAAKLAVRAGLPAVRRLRWCEIEVRRLESGAPVLRAYDPETRAWEPLAVELSMSHTEKWAAAFVIGAA
ncbi:MAG TPA: hypothetical protein VFQ61_21755 [Polyangiaceae bacterium]|nr:hypothetical protein [Polyangiaceae bacterium]